jgi:hypothetical protein
MPTERPIQSEPPPASAVPPSAPGLADPRALTILTTEHWSLLSARALVYNEAFARAGMFLTFLSATLVALGLVSASMGFSHSFLVIVAVVLAVDLFVGLATMGRVATATNEDVRFLQGMNRLRHAYHETVPGLDRYFITGKYDDIRGVFEVYGATAEITSREGILHGFTTVAGMVGVICAAVAGVLSGVIAQLLFGFGQLAGLVAIVVFLAGVGLSVWAMVQKVVELAESMRSIFPTPVAAGPEATTED